MADRLISVYTSDVEAADRLAGLRAELADAGLTAFYEDLLDGGVRCLQLLAPTGRSEQVLDIVRRRLDGRATPQIVVLPVEVSLPAADDRPAPKHGAAPPLGRISREELYTDVRQGVGITATYLALVCLSTVVAAIGLLRDNTAVVIGAMVLAPLLGPNIALALATTLGDLRLATDATKTAVVGLLVSLALAIAVGALHGPGLQAHELIARTDVSLSDVALALAAGVGAAMSLTGGLSASLLGVMVAVALMPPTVATGVFLGAGDPAHSLRALLMLATNVACVNLAAVVTFRLQGLRPRTWWDANRAARATRIAMMLWVILVVGAATLIAIARSV